jgi:amino acid adenylation domain-containing protein
MTDFSSRLEALSPQRRAILVQQLAQRRAAAAGRTARQVPRRPEGMDRLPLSALQERLWVMDQVDPDILTAYNVPAAYRLRGAVDVELLRRSMSRIVRRHEALRTTFADEDGVPYQVIHPPFELELPVEDLTGMDPRQRAAEATRRAGDLSRQRFDLRHGPLIQAVLYRLGAEDHLLVVPIHHICADGWSVGVFVAELAELYAAGRAGREPVLPELPLQYADFTVWQQHILQQDRTAQKLAYWERRLAGAASLDLPTDRPRPATPSVRGRGLTHHIGADIVDPLRELAQSTGATLFMVLTSALQVVLARYTGQHDMVVGTATAGRDRPELEPLIGLFTNLVALRTDLSGNPTLAEVLTRVKETTLDAFDNQDAPYDRVAQRVQAGRDLTRNPLFPVAMDLQRADTLTFELPGVAAEMVSVPQGTARFDIAINAFEGADGVTLWFEYSTDLFDEPRMRRLLGHFERVLTAFGKDPSVRMADLPLLSDVEQARLLEWALGKDIPFRTEPVHALIAEQAARTPDAAAVVYSGQSLSYAELDRRAGLLARHLRRLGTRHEDIVAVGLDRSLDQIIALVGVLKAGAAFVPLDRDDPPERSRYVLEDTGARLVLTSSALLDRLPDVDGRTVVCLDQAWPELEALADEPLQEWASADSLVYVLYTSGSTGKPKGVLIEHGGLSNFITYLTNLFDLGPADRLLQSTSLVFDLAEGEIFTGLAVGATLVLVPHETSISPTGLAELMRRERVTYIGTPPAMLSLMDPEGYPDLRYLLVGGEAFSGELVNKWNLPGRRFVNGYGPTEITIGATFYICEHKTWTGSPPIGRTQPNRWNYLVDRWNNLVPIGVPGELLSGGPGIARGYLNRPELTAEKFVDDPFRPGERVYRTGDLGMWTEDGYIQFLGRVDSQVQLRGVRIEPGEVESEILTHPGVAQAAVTMREDTPGGKRLVAYLVPADPRRPPTDLRDYLIRRLPIYLVPAAFVPMESLPLLSNGKVDRKALPAPEQAVQRRYVAPRTGTERRLAEAFGEVLGADRVGAEDDFFALGGNSLQATRVVVRVRRAVGVELSVREFFTSSSVADLARVVDRLRAEQPRHGGSALVPITPDGDRPALFCVPNISGSAYSYRGLGQLLAPEHPLFAFQAPGLDSDEPALDRVEELARVYTAAMREQQPAGPYHLVGYSAGGMIALEMALQLVDAGQRVAALTLVDTEPPVAGEPPSPADLLQLFAANLAGALDRPEVPQLDPAIAALPEPAMLDRLLAELRAADLLPADVGADFLARRLRVFTATARAIWRYAPARAFPGRLDLVRAAETASSQGTWAGLAAAVREQVVPGTHFSMWAEPNLPLLAGAIRDCLARAASEVPG